MHGLIYISEKIRLCISDDSNEMSSVSFSEIIIIIKKKITGLCEYAGLFYSICLDVLISAFAMKKKKRKCILLSCLQQ